MAELAGVDASIALFGAAGEADVEGSGFFGPFVLRGLF